MVTPYIVLQVVDIESLVKTQVTTALLKTENKCTLLLVQSCPLPLCPLMPPLSTLNSATVRRKVTRGQDEIFVLQRDQMLCEPLKYAGELWKGRHLTSWLCGYWLTDHHLTWSHSEEGCPNSTDVVWAAFTVGREAKWPLDGTLWADAM